MEEKARPPPFMISYHPFYRDLNQQNGKSPGHCKAWPGDFYFLKVNFQAVSTVANVLQTPPASTGVVGVLNTEYPEIPRLISAQRKRKSTRILNIICGNKDTACYNGDTPKNGGDGRPMQRPTPKLQWEGTGLTRHCLSCHARLRKLSAGPPIAAFDLRRLRSGQHRTLVSHSKLNR